MLGAELKNKKSSGYRTLETPVPVVWSEWSSHSVNIDVAKRPVESYVGARFPRTGRRRSTTRTAVLSVASRCRWRGESILTSFLPSVESDTACHKKSHPEPAYITADRPIKARTVTALLKPRKQAQSSCARERTKKKYQQRRKKESTTALWTGRRSSNY